MFSYRKFRIIAPALLLLTMLAGCSEQPGQTSEKGAVASASKKQESSPADERVVELYQVSCKTCHENQATGAPLTGDSDAWKERMKKGMDVLLQSAINGSGAMPPLGLCMECDENDFKALIQYMAEQ
ncbi:MAG: c-type cytochrome [Endozoicomonas sp.]